MATKSKYADDDKDTLVESIKARRTAGRTVKVDLRASEEKLAAALDADDMENGDFVPASEDDKDTQPPEDRSELTPEALGKGDTARGIPAAFKGAFSYLRDGEHKGKVFGLKILPDSEVRGHRTHTAQAADRTFWDGTEAEFRAQFDKL